MDELKDRMDYLTPKQLYKAKKDSKTGRTHHAPIGKKVKRTRILGSQAVAKQDAAHKAAKTDKGVGRLVQSRMKQYKAAKKKR